MIELFRRKALMRELIERVDHLEAAAKMLSSSVDDLSVQLDAERSRSAALATENATLGDEMRQMKAEMKGGMEALSQASIDERRQRREMLDQQEKTMEELQKALTRLSTDLTRQELQTVRDLEEVRKTYQALAERTFGIGADQTLNQLR